MWVESFDLPLSNYPPFSSKDQEQIQTGCISPCLHLVVVGDGSKRTDCIDKYLRCAG